MKNVLRAVTLILSSALAGHAMAQSSPNLIDKQVPTAAQWNSYFIKKQDVLNFSPLNLAGGVMSGKLTTSASSASSSGFNITPGVAPSSPNNGDVWTTSSGVFARIAGVTVGPFVGSSASSFTATQPLAVSFGSGVTNFTLNYDSSFTTTAGLLSLSAVNSNVGTFGSSTQIPVITTNAKGQITAVSVLAPVVDAANMIGTTIAPGVTGSSLTTVGTLVGGSTASGFTLNIGSSNVLGLLPLANGGCHIDLSSTGGTGQVLRQSSLGGNCSVGTLSAFDLSNGVTGTGATVLAISPALTGVPTAPNAAFGNNTTQLATTSFVQNAVAGATAGVASIGGSTGIIVATDGISVTGQNLGTSFTQTGSGAVAQTIPDKLRQTVNVFDFMTASQKASVTSLSCTVDVTSAVQAAHTAAGVYGRVVYPTGSYLLSSTILARYGQWIDGVGPNGSHICRTGDYGSTYRAGGGSPAADASAGPFHVSGMWMTQGQSYSPGVRRVNYNSIITAVALATTSGLNANTYSNGSSGVGATLTATANGIVIIDGVQLIAGFRILVKNEGVASKNGIYVVTQAGSVSTPYVLTRAVEFDQSSEMLVGASVSVLLGPTYGNQYPFALQFSVPTVGTSPVVFGPSDPVAATVSPMNANTYSNGTSGVGATLTATANGIIIVDGVTTNQNDIILVKNEANSSNNGLYSVTQVGTGVPYILTRIGDFDQPAEMVATAYATPLFGTTNGGRSFNMATAVTNVGTDPVTFNGIALDHLATSGAHLELYYAQGMLIENTWLWRMPYQIYAPGATSSTITTSNLTGYWDTLNTGAQEGLAHIFLGSVIAGPNPAILKISQSSFFGSATPPRYTTYTSTTGNVSIYGVQTNPSKYMIDTQGCEDCTFGPGNYFGGPTIAGIHFGSINSTNTGPTLDIKILSNFFDGGSGTDISFDTQTPNSVTGATVTGNTFNGGGISRHAMTASTASGTTTVLGLAVTGNSLYYHRGAPIDLAGAGSFNVSSNTIFTYNYNNISLTDPSYSSAINVYGVSTNGSIFGNTVCGGNSYTYDGVVVLSSLTNVIATNNQDNGCTRFYGGMNGGPWRAFTPAVTINGGTGTSSAGSTGAYWMASDKTLCVRARLTPSWATLPTGIFFTLPNSLVSKTQQIAAGRNDSTTGKMLQGVVGAAATGMVMYNYDGSNPLAGTSGDQLAVGPTCMEVQ